MSTDFDRQRRIAAFAFVALLVLSVFWPSPVVSTNRLCCDASLPVDELSFLGRERALQERDKVLLAALTKCHTIDGQRPRQSMFKGNLTTQGKRWNVPLDPSSAFEGVYPVRHDVGVVS